MKLDTLFEQRILWKPIPGWANYEVSNTGLVRVTNTGMILRQEHHYGNDKTHPYLRVMLRDGERRANVRVSRAVAFAFLGNPRLSNMEVDHVDGNTTNNNVSNLEWVTPEENLRRRRKNRSIIDVKPITKNRKTSHETDHLT